MRSSRSASLASLFPLLVAACSGTGLTDDPGTSDGGVVPSDPAYPLALTCATADTRWTAATPGPSLDGFVVRRMKGGSQTEFTVVRTIRELCTKATSITECTAATAELPETVAGWDPLAGYDGGRQQTLEFAVTTKGDEAERLTTVAQLGAALAPIETADEAAILAALSGYLPVGCLGNAETPKSVTGAKQTADGWELRLQSPGDCGQAVTEAIVRVGRDGKTEIVSTKVVRERKTDGPVCGRRPCALERAAATDLDDPASTGALLAQMAYLEAASVPAFAILARDLAAHGAPRPLLERIERARKDEIRHARLMRRAAKRFGVMPPVPRVGAVAPRSLRAIAEENAVEGCVRETFGALIATYQARHAVDPELAALFTSIARDETEHAELSWDLAAWLDGELSAEDREAVDSARRHAIAELGAGLRDSQIPDREVAGVPDSATSRALLRALESTLLAA